jgi:BASS family bile acid:Na+ symporter
MIIGYLLGGPAANTRSVLGLGSAQRNLSAALIVAGQNFADDPNVMVMILVAGLLGLVVLMVIGGELGKRSEGAAA